MQAHNQSNPQEAIASDVLNYVEAVLANMPAGWLEMTTHRLDIYVEKLAKVQFLEQFETLFEARDASLTSLSNLATAYDYIRLGHPLSCVFEWAIGKLNNFPAENVICFSSKITPILAILRTNLLKDRNTLITYVEGLPASFDADIIKSVYGYKFELKRVDRHGDIPAFEGSTIFISKRDDIANLSIQSAIDFYVSFNDDLGSVLLTNGTHNESYISEIQHVRRRETIAMTPADCLIALRALTRSKPIAQVQTTLLKDKALVTDSIQAITGTTHKVLVGSSGLSIQYAIMMGLIHDAITNHPGKKIKIVVPPNCYGGTNDQARRIAACLELVEIVDLPVDGDHDMVHSVDLVLTYIASEDAIPYIIAEIPTNPRVEVPELEALKAALGKERYTLNGERAIEPVFILDQTFCPNVLFLGEGKILSEVRAISYTSGSKFPSGGKCTAGYCVGNAMAADLMDKIEYHLNLCDNEATELQYNILAEGIPTMLERIAGAYLNTRSFVNFIIETLPGSKINFVSEELAEEGFTPSVFSLDLPTKGDTDEERESYKRALNLKLINLMITEIPDESKFCVSYGQLKGCYWTIPATSTQGTTKEGDKDYIVRASLSANMNLALHKQVFSAFAASI